MFSKVHGFDYQIDFKSPGWEKVNIAKEIRHRLTHPIKGADIKVSRQDYDNVALAAGGFLDQQETLMIETKKHKP
jgi:hypothetical protein